ncbi:MAG: NADH-quinone oxidoreductase subunit NuoG [Fimbriimonadaceae bacterium]
MATVAGGKTVKITINNQELQVPEGELIVESVKRLGMEIPIFCYHPRMKPVGMCRMCLVEVGFEQPDGSVRRMPKPQAGCTLPASEGMVVYTDTEQVHKDRVGVLEFLLINHPLDCPICDRGGECPLQNNTLAYGPSTSRYLEIKRHLPKAFPLSKYVTLDLERCIQCGRCVRFTEEISGDSELAFRFRGAQMQPTTFELRQFTSKFSGNVIEICPVGALTSSKYRFRARPWDLQTRPAICTVCSLGCNIWFDYRVGKMVRINARTNEAINEEWTCDKGKFGQEFYNSNKRITQPFARRGHSLEPIDWIAAYDEILSNFKDGGEAVATIGGSRISNEDQYLFQRLFRDRFGSQNIDHRQYSHLISADQRPEVATGQSSTPTPIADFENLSAIGVFATSLADELPILFLRVRKAWFKNGAKVVVFASSETDVDSFAHVVVSYAPGRNLEMARAISAAFGNLPAEELDSLCRDAGCDAARFREAVEALSTDDPAWITSTGMYDLPNGVESLETLRATAKVGGFQLNTYPLQSNEYGANVLGILPDLGPGYAVLDSSGLNTEQILRAAASRRIKALWLVDCDPILEFPDRDLAAAALENVDYLVYQGVLEAASTAYASLILPLAAPAEGDGTYTNAEGRVQLMKQVIPPPGQCKAMWRVCTELDMRISPTTPYFSTSEVFDAIAREVKPFAGLGYADLGGEGELLKL